MPANIQELVARTAAAVRDPLAHDGRPLVVDVNELLVQSSGFAKRWPAMARFVKGLLDIDGPRHHDLASPDFDPSLETFDPETMTFLLQARSEGRAVYL